MTEDRTGSPARPTVRTARDAARTRDRLLTAATRVLIARGPSMSLDEVASTAGVSKGGLLHHFPSKEALIVALVERWLATYELAVRAHLDPDDDRPGRLARAHVRASFDELGDGAWRHPAVMAAIMAIPEVGERVRATERRWQEELLGDGLHPERAQLLLLALDGVTMGDLLAGRDRGDLARTRDLLLALAEHEGPVVPARS